MIVDCPANDFDDFPYPNSEHEGNDDSSDCDEYMEAPIRSRRVSNSSLWGAAEDVLTPVTTAASSSSSATFPHDFFKDGICMKRLFDDVMVDKSSDSGLASSSSHIPMPTGRYEGIETWHPNKVFVAVVEFAAPRWSVIINKHTKVIGKTINVRQCLLELQADPLMSRPGPVKWDARVRGFRCLTKWVARFSGMTNAAYRKKMSNVWQRFGDDIKARWVLLDAILSIPKVERLFPEYMGRSPLPLAAGTPGAKDEGESSPAVSAACWGYLATYNTKIGLHDPQVISWVNEGIKGGELCQLLREHPLYRQCFNRFVVFQNVLAGKMGFRSVAIAMEHSSHASNPARVHLHVYAGVDIRGGIDFMAAGRPSMLKRADLIWEGAADPFVKMTLVRRPRPSQIFHAVATGMYYVVGGKTGNMFKESSLVPIQDCDSRTETTSMALCVCGVLIFCLVECYCVFMQTR
jgi:hypothetical protein